MMKEEKCLKVRNKLILMRFVASAIPLLLIVMGKPRVIIMTIIVIIASGDNASHCLMTHDAVMLDHSGNIPSRRDDLKRPGSQG
jgi:hypothetical protein